MTAHATTATAAVVPPAFVRLLNFCFRRLGLFVADHDKLVLLVSATVRCRSALDVHFTGFLKSIFSLFLSYFLIVGFVKYDLVPILQIWTQSEP